MDMNLNGKTAIVTGSTAGIGFASAAELARMGAEVVITGRTADGVDTAVAELESLIDGAEVRGVAADLGTAEGNETLFERVPSADVLVNNVGIFENVDFFDSENRPSSLIQRLATPEEVANMVAYVCSPAASATNGAPLRVEGGVVRSMG